ncbi:MAG: alpha/beta hydrolase [Myxococcales bacterium]|nr:alpha/beta hydrolase [Myxococcales bacterium]
MTLTLDAATDRFRSAPDDHIDVGNGRVAYRRFGTGPDVLFVHGWPVTGATFRALLPHLAPHVTCHVIDLVGAGDSRFDRDVTIDLGQHVSAVRAVVDALQLRDYAAVGHDSGGMIARHAVAGDPRLRAMALVDTEQPQGLSVRFRQFLSARKIPGFEHVLAWAGMQRRLRRNRLLFGDCFTDRALLDGAFEEFFLAPLWHDRLRRWAAGTLLRSFDTRLVHELTDVHARITVPVQLVWGADDPFFPVVWAREMVQTFPDASLHEVPGAKLFVHEERPLEVAQAMLPALLGTRGATAASRTG